MTDAETIVWGALLAVAVYVVGQLLSKFFIEPLHELRKAVGEVRYTLEFHRPTIHTPIGRSSDKATAAWSALMKSSSELISKVHAVPWYRITRFIAFGVLPERKSIERAAVQLRALSTYVHETGDKANSSVDIVNKQVARIMQLLRLRPLDGEEDV